ncbi:uncharacterized protein LOC130104239 [Rhinichthys klamathensis goyatoka]|uniref:uncharacterized protein LOC130104239 n=1 Tax=Rhinichthys klamathensis goyatoka TaxID=3034132 RepID=UPI0024B496C4|nr:uncharacterized protein LOC130104239 [Rhinichthys klamathensis goyatoka]
MVRQRINYNLNSLLTVFDQSYCGNFTQIRSWLDKEVKYYTSKNPLSSKNRKTRSIWGDIAGVFGSVNSISNTAQMNQLSEYTQWVGTMSGKGLTEALQGSLHIIAAGQHLNDAAKELADALTKSSNFETHRAACLFLAQNLKDQMVEDIQVIRMGQVPERIAESLLVVFGNQLNLTSAKHIPLVKIAINENSLSGSGMLPLIMIWPQYGKRNIMTVRQFQSMGVRQGNSVIRLGRNGYWADGDTPMISTTDCCVEEHEWVICSCSTMFSLSLNGSAVWEVVPLDQATGAWQVSEAQWCILHDGISENMIYGGKLCPIPPDPFCLEILYPLHLGGIHVPHVQLLQLEPQWWNNDLVEERNYELFEMVRIVKKSVKAAQEEGIQAMGHVIVANGVAKLMSERKLPRILGNLSWSDWIVLTMVGVFVFMLIIQDRESVSPIPGLTLGEAKQTWKNAAHPALRNRHKDLAWMVAHEILLVRAVMHSRGMAKDSTCPRSGCNCPETVRHLLWECRAARDLWTRTSPLVFPCLPAGGVQMEYKLAILGVGQGLKEMTSKQFTSLWLTLNHIKDAIWTTRNLLVGKRVTVPLHACEQLVRSTLQEAPDVVIRMGGLRSHERGPGHRRTWPPVDAPSPTPATGTAGQRTGGRGPPLGTGNAGPVACSGERSDGKS